MTMCLGALSGGSPAAAQEYESSLRSLDYAPDPLARSPRLLGMGGLTLTDDLHNHIRFWDFAGNPAGIMDAESLSTFEYRPDTRTGSAFHDVTDTLTTRERQEFSTRHMRHAFEAWRRTPGGAGRRGRGLMGP